MKYQAKRYLQALLLVAVASVVCALLYQMMSPANLVMIYLLAVLVAALYLGRGPSIFVSFLGMLVFDFLFVPPMLTFEVADTEYLLTFLTFLGVGLVISQLTARTQEQTEKARQAEIFAAGEKLQTALLNSISHDLRTPLVTITGALSTLQDDARLLTEADRQSLLETARDEADRLNRLVGNLLDISRVEAGAVRVAHQLCDVEDVIGSALEKLGSRLAERPVQVEIPSDLPLVSLDFVLIVQVLYYVLDNALKYSPPQSPIEIHTNLLNGKLEILVEDRGDGIRPEDLEHVFDKFFRVKRPESVSGTGLGLAISKGFVEAHGGHIEAVNREGGGTGIRISLPVEYEELGAAEASGKHDLRK